jgi:hypothetical protein
MLAMGGWQGGLVGGQLSAGEVLKAQIGDDGRIISSESMALPVA